MVFRYRVVLEKIESDINVEKYLVTTEVPFLDVGTNFPDVDAATYLDIGTQVSHRVVDIDTCVTIGNYFLDNVVEVHVPSEVLDCVHVLCLSLIQDHQLRRYQ